MKRLSTICLLALASIFAMADEQLNIILKDNSYVAYSFAEKPKVTIAGNMLNISAEGVNIQFAMSQVSRFQFGDELGELTSVGEVAADAAERSDGAPTLQIFTLDGMLVRSGSKPNRLNYSDLPKGTYIVRSGKNAHKITIR